MPIPFYIYFMKTFKDVLEPLKDKLTYEKNEYRLVVNTDDKMIYAIPQDKEKGEIITEILAYVSEMQPEMELLFGKRMVHEVPTTTYLDRDGSLINIVRDKEKKQVIFSWIEGRK